MRRERSRWRRSLSHLQVTHRRATLPDGRAQLSYFFDRTILPPDPPQYNAGAEDGSLLDGVVVVL